MNFRFIIRQFGLLLVVLSISILAVASWGLVRWVGGSAVEAAATKALLLSVLVGGLLGGVLWWFGHGGGEFLGRREALLLVAMGWLLGAALAALPYRIWALLVADMDRPHPFSSFIDCYFEAMSGLTTTGATVLGHPDHPIEQMPDALLLWRALTQWLGGLGIIVLFVAVLPGLGVGAKKLFQVEAPGPKASGVRPRIGETARVLWMIYLALTFAEVLALCLAGSSVFDAVCHTFATVATGGFSTHDTSIGGENLAVRIIIIFFMVLAGINFGLYYQLIHCRFRQVWTDPELRLYLKILLIGSIVVVAAIFFGPNGETPQRDQPFDATVGKAVIHGVFQTVAIHTGTGFCITDFNAWGFVAKATLVALMFIGPCSGSTGGGIKVIRVLIAFKVMLAEIERVFRPNVVRSVNVGRTPVDSGLKLAVLVYVLSIVVLFLVGTVLLMVFESGSDCSFTTAAIASAATLNNIGPGLAGVGAIENYSWISAPGKVLLSILMALGRLEIYAVLVLFAPRFWKGQ